MPITKEAIARAEELKLRPDRLEHLEKMLNQWIAEEKRQAVVVKVNRFQTTVFEGAYGTNTKDMPVSCDTIFSVASITKSIIASLAMLLQEDGMLDLTDSVNKYIPEFDGEGREKIRVWHLLCHTSGIVDSDIDEYIEHYMKEELHIDLPEGDTEWEEVKPLFALACEKLGLTVERERYYDALTKHLYYRSPIKREPRSLMSYCNFGYGLMKEIICKLEDAPIDEVAYKRLFEPLGMLDSHFKVPPQKYLRILGRNERCEGYPYINSEDYYNNESGAGGLKSTPNDILKFAEMIANNGIYGGKRVLSVASVKAMTSNHNEGVGTEFDAWGLGFNYHGVKKDDSSLVRSAGALDHGGWAGTKFLIDAEYGITAVVFTAEYHGVAFNLFGCFFNILYSALN